VIDHRRLRPHPFGDTNAAPRLSKQLIRPQLSLPNWQAIPAMVVLALASLVLGFVVYAEAITG